MIRFFAVLAASFVLASQSLAQTQKYETQAQAFELELERRNLTSIEDALDEVERLWNDRNVEDLTVMAAVPFNIITPDGIYRNSYFLPNLDKLLTQYFDGETPDKLELQFSNFSMLNEDLAHVEATGVLGEKKIVVSALLVKFEDGWKAHRVHISNLSEQKSFGIEERNK